MAQKKKDNKLLRVPLRMLEEEASLGITIEDEVLYGNGERQLKARKELHRSLIKLKKERYLKDSKNQVK